MGIAPGRKWTRNGGLKLAACAVRPEPRPVVSAAQRRQPLPKAGFLGRQKEPFPGTSKGIARPSQIDCIRLKKLDSGTHKSPWRSGRTPGGAAAGSAMKLPFSG